MIRRVRLELVCDVDWSALPVVDGHRWCNRCERAVHDLGRLTEDEAQPLLRERAERRVCVVYRPNADGSIRFKQRAGLALAASVLAACNAPSASPDPTTVTPAPIVTTASSALDVKTTRPAANAAQVPAQIGVEDTGTDAVRVTALHGKDASVCSPVANATPGKHKAQQPARRDSTKQQEMGGY